MFWFGALPPYFHQTRDICNSSNDDEYRHQPTNQAGVLSGSLVQYSHIFLASPSSSHNCLTNHCLNINTSQPGLISCQPQKKNSMQSVQRNARREFQLLMCVAVHTRRQLINTTFCEIQQKLYPSRRLNQQFFYQLINPICFHMKKKFRKSFCGFLTFVSWQQFALRYLQCLR